MKNKFIPVLFSLVFLSCGIGSGNAQDSGEKAPGLPIAGTPVPTTPMETSLSCYRALHRWTFASGIWIEYLSENVVLLATSETAKKGFYLFNEHAGWFQSFPTPPAAEGSTDYFFEIPIGYPNCERDTAYLLYDYTADTISHPYTPTLCRPVPGETHVKIDLSPEKAAPESLGILNKELADEAGSAYEFFEEYPEQRTAQDFLKQLDQCAGVQDGVVRQAIEAEKKKFIAAPSPRKPLPVNRDDRSVIRS